MYSSFKVLLKKFRIPNNHFSLHSPRIGGTTDAFDAQVPGHIIDRRGRWKDPKTKYIYAQNSEQDLQEFILKTALS